MFSVGIISFAAAAAMSAVPLPFAGEALRVSMTFVLLTGIWSSLRRNVSRVEVQWMALLGLYWGFSLVSAFGALDSEAAMIDFLRQVHVGVFSFGLARILRQKRTMFMRWMLLPSATCIIVVLGFLFAYREILGLTLKNLPLFKYIMFFDVGIALNPLSQILVLAFLFVLPVLKMSPWSIAVFLGALAAVVVSGSRTTIVSLVLSVLLYGIWTLFLRFDHSVRVISRIIFAIILVGGAHYVVSVFHEFATGNEFSRLLSGRPDLWRIAWDLFLARPILGWGPHTWKMKLASYVLSKGYFQYERLLELQSGAFHNAYLTLLAERGIIAFFPGMAIVTFLVWQSLRLHRNSSLLVGADRLLGLLAPIVIIMLVIRGLAEQPGLLGYANSTVDYLCYAWASMIVALSSDLEDRRATRT